MLAVYFLLFIILVSLFHLYIINKVYGSIIAFKKAENQTKSRNKIITLLTLDTLIQVLILAVSYSFLIANESLVTDIIFCLALVGFNIWVLLKLRKSAKPRIPPF